MGKGSSLQRLLSVLLTLALFTSAWPAVPAAAEDPPGPTQGVPAASPATATPAVPGRPGKDGLPSKSRADDAPRPDASNTKPAPPNGPKAGASSADTLDAGIATGTTGPTAAAASTLDSPGWFDLLVLNPTQDPNKTCTDWYSSGSGVNGTPEKLLHTISLAAYAGKRVQIRFYFDSRDGNYNNREGWYVDDISVSGGGTTALSNDGSTLSGWSVVGSHASSAPKWQVTTRRNADFGSALWYGNSETGTFQPAGSSTSACGDVHTYGAVISPAITVPASTPIVQFSTLWQIEAVDPHAFDMMRIQIFDLTPDLRVFKRVPVGSPTSVAPGRDITWTVQVLNAGGGPATSVTLVDTLPAGVTFKSVTTTQGTCDPGTGTVTCALGTIAGDCSSGCASVTVTLVVAAPSTEGAVTNTATASTPDTELTTANNTGTHTVTVARPDLRVSISDSPDPVATGANVQYQLSILNFSTTAATGVHLEQTLATGSTFVSASASAGSCAHASGVVTCDRSSLAGFVSWTVNVVAKAPATAGDFATTAVAAHDDPDKVPADNTASATTRAKHATTTTATDATATFGDASVTLRAQVAYSAQLSFCPPVDGSVTFLVATSPVDQPDNFIYRIVSGVAADGFATSDGTSCSSSTNFVGTLSLAGYNAGTYVFQTDYSGSDTFFAHQKPQTSLTIGKADTSTSAFDAIALVGETSVPLRADVGMVTCAITPCAVIGDGNITFTVTQDATTVGTVAAPVAGGSATAAFPLAGVAEGTYSIGAGYGGGTNFKASADPTPQVLRVIRGILGVAECGTPPVRKPNALVELYSGSGDPPIATTTSDAVTAEYVFVNVPPGTYEVRVVASDGTCGVALTVGAGGTGRGTTLNPPIDLQNHSWRNSGNCVVAFAPPGAPLQTGAVEQHIYKKGQAVYCRIPVSQGDKVKLVAKAPFPIHMTLYGNPDQLAARTPTGTSGLFARGLEFADGDFADGDFADGDFADGDFADGDFADGDFADGDFADGDFADGDFADGDFADGDFADGDFADGDFADGDFADGDFADGDFADGDFAPEHLSPGEGGPFGDENSSLLSRSRIGISARGGTTDERLIGIVWGNPGHLIVKITGTRDAFSLAAPVRLEAFKLPGSCVGVSELSPSIAGGNYTTIAAAAGAKKTVLVVDRASVAGTPDEIATMTAAITDFVNATNGIAIDVGSDSRVAAARAQALANARCPWGLNLWAYEVKRIIDAFRPDVENVVLAGGLDGIPDFAEPDRSAIAGEWSWAGPPVAGDSFSQAVVRRGYLNSQIRYGSSVEFSLNGDTVPIADIGVGRLVETAAEITGMLRAYLALPGGELTVNTPSLVTGYGNMSDGAGEIAATLATGTGVASDTLIHTGGPKDAGAWTAQQLRTKLFGSRHDISFIAMHASQGSALAANYDPADRLLAAEIPASGVDMANTVTFALACHYGYPSLDPHLLSIAIRPDFAQAYARKGGYLISGTGYQYFDTDIVEYGERLYLKMAQNLYRGGNPVALGKDVVATALREYITTPPYDGTHLKQYLEVALYGIPNLKIRTQPATRFAPPPVTQIGTESVPLATGLRMSDRSLALSSTPQPAVPLRDAITGTALTPGGTYLTGPHGTFSIPTQPILPLQQFDAKLRDGSADANSYALRGVGIVGGTFSTDTGVRPLTSAPATEITSVHATFYSDIFTPVVPFKTSYVQAAVGGAELLNVTGVQHVSQTPGSELADRRVFSALGVRLFWSNDTSAAADCAAPAISDVSALRNDGASTPENSVYTFRARVSGCPATSIVKAWVTYVVAGGTSLQSFELQPTSEAGVWQADHGFGTTPPSSVRYMLQAANGVGLVGRDTANGFWRKLGPDSPTFEAPRQATSLTLVPVAPQTAVPTGGTYGDVVRLAARLTAGTAPLAGQIVHFQIGGQRASGTTDATGVAAVEMKLRSLADRYTLLAAFDQTTAYLASATAPAPFDVSRMPTAITLTPAGSTQFSDPTSVVATLRESLGTLRALDQQAIVFVLTAADGRTYATSEITDFAGRARLFAPAPPDTYTVRAYFNGTIPLPGGSITLVDARYSPSTATLATSLTITPEDGSFAYAGELATVPGAALDAATRITQAADGAIADLSQIQVRYELRSSDGTLVRSATAAFGDGSWSAAIDTTGLAYGVYDLEARTIGGHFAAEPARASIGVYDPSRNLAASGQFKTAAACAGGSVDGTCTIGFASGAQAKITLSAQYPPGATSPGGGLVFQVPSASYVLQATSFDWLVVVGNRATLEGSGVVNGEAGWRFRVIATDLVAGTKSDDFEIRIWRPGTNSFADPNKKVAQTASPSTVTIH